MCRVGCRLRRVGTLQQDRTAYNGVVGMGGIRWGWMCKGWVGSDGGGEESCYIRFAYQAGSMVERGATQI
jgi:hypothetical protein